MTDGEDVGTCEQILRLIVERGPITAGELARILVLTPAAVRRHISSLVADDLIQTHEGNSQGPARRGRPSRRYVATAAGQELLGQGYADLANQALAFLRNELGNEGVAEFVQARTQKLESRYRSILERSGESTAEKSATLAEALTKDGFVATLRRGGPHALAIQLCQGHCPIQEVAKDFPEMCEAETQAFARLLGVPIQRLSTLASGGHVCTTNILLGIPQNLRPRHGSQRITPEESGDREGNK
ncbi:MarR family transcriptional regulator [Arcanobacterium haemolyticum]|uniref:Transcriptional regulator n=1 Tax=Arcanobacterium haemolyticum (strain ATCC 9345 / DSM 20595 / CCM 5947 / CCUG 17215 / LMG 16163 / NBRC 15585 / NCTC 8452 / 11018) TaxID=644284 RepID=D7BP11_ARCHD|nr:helix-turn-helix domain-containing protein [Arcanobacterium haemolyticum]ADH92660.1 putative transcriptional regulator [Arcanobacterium haemolyticum DSM 20595]QCX46770.1 MarR family transcriptional regulator [Arcanobacterium haemolyticum]SQH28603.1 iron-sulfur cluster biosynthesis transcriptional regulator SufR [Arcanobacterium haemolyticum]